MMGHSEFLINILHHLMRTNIILDSLFSFAKFLELLCYSPTLCTLTPSLCDHTTPSSSTQSTSNPTLPASRLEIVRNFSYQLYTVTVDLSAIDDVFELRVPKLQILRTNGSSNNSERPNSASKDIPLDDTSGDEEKKALRREIKSWWQGVADHIDKLVSSLLSQRQNIDDLTSGEEFYT